jgi:hypothetical protein
MRPTTTTALAAFVALTLVASAGCGGDDEAVRQEGAETTRPPGTTTTSEPPEAAPDTTTTSAPTTTEAPEPDEPEVDPRHERPDWLGTRPLPLRDDGLGEILPTPPELVDRQLATPAHLPPPPDESFHAAVVEVPAEVVERSTWQPACPVGLDELRYGTVSFWGFDGLHHTGELLVHRDAADALVAVFERLHEARFPLEEMRVTRAEELDLHPTGDGNNTGAFVCRPSVGATSWSEHAYGTAIDLNPFHNPLVRGDLVVPELASAYADRDAVRPGMIVAGDAVTSAFADIGWGWGGDWSTSKDWMHFSATGR